MDTRMMEGKSVGPVAYLVIVAGLALTVMLSGTARAGQEPQQQDQLQQQSQDQGRQTQAKPDQQPTQDQAQQAQPTQPQDQTQAPASPDRPAAPPVAKAKPKYASQDANKPPYANDRQNPSPYSAPSPDVQNDPEEQDQQPQDDRQAPPPQYRGRATRPPQAGNRGDYANAQPSAPLPASLTIPAGAILSVRMNEFVSSDKNQVGDRVTATLERPIVVNGWVVARRGQVLTGQVTAATKAGRIKGTSQLGLELTDLSLVDGANAPILTEIWKGSGGTSHGADAAAIGGTTALGAAIGAAADWGRGAAIGAGAGAAAGIGAVLLTRGRPTEILPEAPLTFRLVDPVTVDTTKSAQAFAPVTQQDYDSGGRGERRPRLRAGGYPAPYYYGCGYYEPCYGYPGYYAPAVVVYGGGWGYRGRRW